MLPPTFKIIYWYRLVLKTAKSHNGAIERRLGGNFPVIRAMPNTPSMVGAGISAICKGKFASDKDLDAARKLFDAFGA